MRTLWILTALCLSLLTPAMAGPPFHGAMTPASVDCYGPTTVRGDMTARGAINASTSTMTIATVAAQVVSVAGSTALTNVTAADTTVVVTGTGTRRFVRTQPGSPTATVGVNATNGTANTFMRSDGAPALKQDGAYNLSNLVGVTSQNITNTSLSVNRVIHSTTGGKQKDTAGFTFDGWSFAVPGPSSLGGAVTQATTVPAIDTPFTYFLTHCVSTDWPVWLGGIRDGGNVDNYLCLNARLDGGTRAAPTFYASSGKGVFIRYSPYSNYGLEIGTIPPGAGQTGTARILIDATGITVTGAVNASSDSKIAGTSLIHTVTGDGKITATKTGNSVSLAANTGTTSGAIAAGDDAALVAIRNSRNGSAAWTSGTTVTVTFGSAMPDAIYSLVYSFQATGATPVSTDSRISALRTTSFDLTSGAEPMNSTSVHYQASDIP